MHNLCILQEIRNNCIVSILQKSKQYFPILHSKLESDKNDKNRFETFFSICFSVLHLIESFRSSSKKIKVKVKRWSTVVKLLLTPFPQLADPVSLWPDSHCTHLFFACIDSLKGDELWSYCCVTCSVFCLLSLRLNPWCWSCRGSSRKQFWTTIMTQVNQFSHFS